MAEVFVVSYFCSSPCVASCAVIAKYLLQKYAAIYLILPTIEAVSVICSHRCYWCYCCSVAASNVFVFKSFLFTFHEYESAARGKLEPINF